MRRCKKSAIIHDDNEASKSRPLSQHRRWKLLVNLLWSNHCQKKSIVRSCKNSNWNLKKKNYFPHDFEFNKFQDLNLIWPLNCADIDPQIYWSELTCTNPKHRRCALYASSFDASPAVLAPRACCGNFRETLFRSRAPSFRGSWVHLLASLWLTAIAAIRAL